MWWYTTVFPALGKLKLENLMFEANPGKTHIHNMQIKELGPCLSSMYEALGSIPPTAETK
jgi:hypothetical protein